jgi:hypothetical protein
VPVSRASAISKGDTTSAEDAADRNADVYCDSLSLNSDNGQAICKKHFVEGYLGDKSTQAGGAQVDMYGAGVAERNKDYKQIPDGVCSAYIDAAKGSDKAEKSLSNLKDSEKSEAVKACNSGFRYGLQAGESCSALRLNTKSAVSRDACAAGQNLADLHIFTPDEASGHAKGLSEKEIGSTGNDEGGGQAEDIENACDVNPNPLTWIVCPIIDGINETVKTIDDIITGLLDVGNNDGKVSPNKIFCDKSTAVEDEENCLAYHAAWQSFRNIALGLLVIAVLVALIAQALGTELLDAYTLRKALPRALIAAIGITLSWEIMQFFVALSNALGFGVRFLIQEPFVHAGLDKASLGGGGSTAVALIGLGAIASLTIFGLLSFAVTALIAILVAVVVLILREMVIILLAILAPIAIVCYILPNTQNYYKFWSDSFIRALLMFPMIIAMISIGRVFSAIATTGGGLVAQVIGFAAYFAPYFMIPLTFRFAGTVMSTVGNFAQSSSQGASRGLQQYRAGKRQETGEKRKAAIGRMQTNQFLNENRNSERGRRYAKRANSLLSNITSPGAAAKIHGGKALNALGIDSSMGKSILSQIGQTKLDHSQKLGNKLNELGYNDRALSALGGMSDYSPSSLRETIAGLEASDNPNDHIAATQLANSADFLTKNLRKDEEMWRADVGIAAGFARASQGFMSSAEIADKANDIGGHEGGGALAAGFVTQAQLAAQRAGVLDAKPGYGVQIDKDGKYFGVGYHLDKDGNITDSEADQKRLIAHQVKRILTTGQQEYQGAKGPSVKRMSGGLRAILQAGGFDENGNGSIHYQDENNKPVSIAINKADVERVAAMLGTAQADYSGTAPATSAEIQKIVESAGLSGDTLAAYQRGRRDNIDPSRQGQPDPGEQNTPG